MNKKLNIPDYVIQKIKSLNMHNLSANAHYEPTEILRKNNDIVVENKFDETPTGSLNLRTIESQNFKN